MARIPSRNLNRGSTMYVCLCKGISDRRLHQAVAEGARSFEELQAATGVATCCRSCEPCARGVLYEALDQGERTQ